MRRITSEIMALAMIGAQHEQRERGNPLTPETVKLNHTLVIPNGCKLYFFNRHGAFSNDKMRWDELFFKCVASNDKTAKKKFERHLANNGDKTNEHGK